MKYRSEITGFGVGAWEFLSPEMGLNFIIIFNNTAPPELAELSVLHEPAELKEFPQLGDTFKIGCLEYTVARIGSEAPHTLATLGHCTLVFDDDEASFRPGCIVLHGPKFEPEKISEGDFIEIL